MSSSTPRTATEYRAWWASQAPVPYGFCWCGCGEQTTPAPTSRSETGWVKGEPKRFFRGHCARLRSEAAARQDDEILRRYKSGEKIANITDHLGIDNTTIYNVLRRSGIKSDRNLSRGDDFEAVARYRAWWEEQRPDIPYGLCWCGCGDKAPIAVKTSHRANWLQGQPLRFILGHHLVAGQTSGPRRPLSLEEQSEACRRYRAGENAYSIARRFGTTDKTVYKALERGDVTIRPLSEALRIHSCDHSFFNVIDHEAKAYWLGFVAADGGVNGNTTRVKLARRDRDHLFRLKAALNATQPVGDTVVDGFPQSYLSITSPEMVRGLAAHGVEPRKSLVLKWFGTSLPEHLQRHYLRGYFDGDGGFSIGYDVSRNKNTPKLQWSIIGTAHFCFGAQELLMRSVRASKVQLHPTETPEIFTLNYSGNRQVARIFNFMYEGATVYLPRKHQKVAHLL